MFDTTCLVDVWRQDIPLVDAEAPMTRSYGRQASQDAWSVAAWDPDEVPWNAQRSGLQLSLESAGEDLARHEDR